MERRSRESKVILILNTPIVKFIDIFNIIHRRPIQGNIKLFPVALFVLLNIVSGAFLLLRYFCRSSSSSSYWDLAAEWLYIPSNGKRVINYKGNYKF